MKVNWKDYSQYMDKWKMFQTTNQSHIWCQCWSGNWENHLELGYSSKTCHRDIAQDEMEVSSKRGTPESSILDHFRRILHSKSSILAYQHLCKPQIYLYTWQLDVTGMHIHHDWGPGHHIHAATRNVLASWYLVPCSVIYPQVTQHSYGKWHFYNIIADLPFQDGGCP